MNGLIGYTGFVGHNIDNQCYFDKRYNSKNINEIKNQSFDLLVCAGVSAVKWMANKHPEQDNENINSLLNCLKTVNAKKMILISTIDIYDNPDDVDENDLPCITLQDTYGKNRYYFEQWVKNNFEDTLIIRLPALFGNGLKKNFIYDAITLVPSMIIENKWNELIDELSEDESELLIKNYELDLYNNRKLASSIDELTKEKLKQLFKKINFTSLEFTDSRSCFPFYDLKNLWKDIMIAIKMDIELLNISVEPLSCSEVANEVFGFEFTNELDKKPLKYNMKSVHFKVFNGQNGYLYSKVNTIESLRLFVAEMRGK